MLPNGHVESLIQDIYPTLEVQGPVTLRQDRSYMHQIQRDPTGQYLFGPDLGGDRIRVYTFDNTTLQVTEQAPLRTEAGVGPRHGVFWRSSSDILYFIFVGEISQKVYSYQITYSATGVTWSKVGEIVGLGNDNEKPAGTAPQSAIVLSVSHSKSLFHSMQLTLPARQQIPHRQPPRYLFQRLHTIPNRGHRHPI